MNIAGRLHADFAEVAYRSAITRIARYANLGELLAHEDAEKYAPDVPREQLLDILRGVYPPDKEALGVVAPEIARTMC